VEPPTIEAALRAAGDDRRISATPVHEGDQITVSDDGIRHHPRGNPLLIGLPVDVNDASTEALEAVPGIGPAVASAIVENRNLEGPFYEVGDLVRVPGLGPKKVEGLAPLLTVGDIGPRPPVSLIDVNTASAAALERLPGIGPTLAARIVVDRAEQGRFRTLDDLRRVRGITPATIHRLRTYAEAR
jgi:competence protein ComEA